MRPLRPAQVPEWTRVVAQRDERVRVQHDARERELAFAYPSLPVLAVDDFAHEYLAIVVGHWREPIVSAPLLARAHVDAPVERQRNVAYDQWLVVERVAPVATGGVAAVRYEPQMFAREHAGHRPQVRLGMLEVVEAFVHYGSVRVVSVPECVQPAYPALAEERNQRVRSRVPARAAIADHSAHTMERGPELLSPASARNRASHPRARAIDASSSRVSGYPRVLHARAPMGVRPSGKLSRGIRCASTCSSCASESTIPHMSCASEQCRRNPR